MVGSYFQPASYVGTLTAPKMFSLQGGKRKRNRTRKIRGGFYPSLMGGVLSNGPYFFTPALASAAKLLRNSQDRLRSRRKAKTGRSKRSRNATKNTRKA